MEEPGGCLELYSGQCHSTCLWLNFWHVPGPNKAGWWPKFVWFVPLPTLGWTVRNSRNWKVHPWTPWSSVSRRYQEITFIQSAQQSSQHTILWRRSMYPDNLPKRNKRTPPSNPNSPQEHPSLVFDKRTLASVNAKRTLLEDLEYLRNHLDLVI